MYNAFYIRTLSPLHPQPHQFVSCELLRELVEEGLDGVFLRRFCLGFEAGGEQI